MTTLITPPVSTLLARLFAGAETIDAGLEQRAALLSPEERTKRMTSATEYQKALFRLEGPLPCRITRNRDIAVYAGARD